ncbi:MAG: hypothetical protein Q9170_006956, partial [Blastenia crenularia]
MTSSIKTIAFIAAHHSLGHFTTPSGQIREETMPTNLTAPSTPHLTLIPAAEAKAPIPLNPPTPSRNPTTLIPSSITHTAINTSDIAQPTANRILDPQNGPPSNQAQRHLQAEP